jgi:hypothetical protein
MDTKQSMLLGVFAIVVVGVLVFGLKVLPTSSTMDIKVVGHTQQLPDGFFFAGEATFKNTGTSSATGCTTLVIYDLATPVVNREICKTVAAGSTEIENLKIPLDPEGVYGWEYK